MKRDTKRKSWPYVAAVSLFLSVFGLIAAMAQWPSAKHGSGNSSEEPITSKRVTMIDLGAHKCIPCKMMAPILEELKEEYAGKADIIFIDVWERPDQAARYGIRVIPTQIFYDHEGKEFYRNVGFMDKKRIVAIFDKLGVPRGNGR